MSSENRAEVEYGTCPVCGYVMLPVLAMSPCGHSAEPVLAPLDGVGVVYSWTRVWSDETAQTLAMADFLDGRLRITAPVLGSGEVAIGDLVTASSGDDTPIAISPVT